MPVRRIRRTYGRKINDFVIIHRKNWINSLQTWWSTCLKRTTVKIKQNAHLDDSIEIAIWLLE
jgi:hypothetical protein